MGTVRRVQTNTWLLLLTLVVWLAVNVRWVITYRRRQVLDIDEAGYVGMALNDHYAAGRDGLTGWLRAVEAHSIQAPLTSALTSVQFLLTGPYVITAFAVPLLAGLATVLLTYGLGNRIGGRALAWPATLLVAVAPAVIVESRAYHFTGPATAISTAALYCLARSDRLTRTGFAIGFGVLVGLMPLTRTMTIAFVPGLLLAAILQASIGPDRGRRCRRCAAAIAVAVGVAALWLVPNGGMVFRYLAGFGYGAQSRDSDLESGLLNPSAWLARLRMLVNDEYLPHVLVIGAGLIAATIFAVRASRTSGVRDALRRVAASPLLPSVALIVGGYAALISSSNAGLYFALPLLPAMIVVAVLGLSRMSLPRRVLPVVVAVVVVLAGVPQLDLRAPTAALWTAELPLIGGVKITDGRGTLQSYEGVGTGTDEREPVPVEVAQRWIAASDWAAKQIVEANALRGTTAFGFRDRLFNTNTVQLAMLQSKGYGVRLAMINPTEIGSSRTDYESWLTVPHDSLNGDASPSCLLFTATGTVNEFTPAVDLPAMEQAARTSGFSVLSTLPLPNGRLLTLWRRNQPTCG